MGRLQQRVQLLLKVDDTPHRTALSFGLGVFIAFFPIFGIHTGIALFVAFAFRLSRIPILLGTWVNNPWTIAPMYMGGTLLGCALLGISLEEMEPIDWSLKGHSFWHALAGLRPYLWPYVVGNTILGILAGAVAYFILRLFLERRRVLNGESAS